MAHEQRSQPLPVYPCASKSRLYSLMSLAALCHASYSFSIWIDGSFMRTASASGLLYKEYGAAFTSPMASWFQRFSFITRCKARAFSNWPACETRIRWIRGHSRGKWLCTILPRVWALLLWRSSACQASQGKSSQSTPCVDSMACP